MFFFVEICQCVEFIPSTGQLTSPFQRAGGKFSTTVYGENTLDKTNLIHVTYKPHDKPVWWGCWDVAEELCSHWRRCSRLKTKLRLIAWRTHSPTQQNIKVKRSFVDCIFLRLLCVETCIWFLPNVGRKQGHTVAISFWHSSYLCQCSVYSWFGSCSGLVVALLLAGSNRAAVKKVFVFITTCISVHGLHTKCNASVFHPVRDG